jgi:hypothetical protein
MTGELETRKDLETSIRGELEYRTSQFDQLESNFRGTLTELESTLISTSAALLTKGEKFLLQNSANPTKYLPNWVTKNSDDIKTFNSKVNSTPSTSLSTFTQSSGGNMTNILDYMETKADQYNSMISEIFEDATKIALEKLGLQKAQFVADKGRLKKKIRERFGFYRKA